jgi:hypothetical protein
MGVVAEPEGEILGLGPFAPVGREVEVVTTSDRFRELRSVCLGPNSAKLAPLGTTVLIREFLHRD